MRCVLPFSVGKIFAVDCWPNELLPLQRVHAIRSALLASQSWLAWFRSYRRSFVSVAWSTCCPAMSAFDPAFDFDGNGELDRRDIDAWLSFAGEVLIDQTFLFGDVNLDGIVDARDPEVIQENLFREDTAWTTGDMNVDVVTDVADFDLWNDAWCNQLQPRRLGRSLFLPRGLEPIAHRVRQHHLSDRHLFCGC